MNRYSRRKALTTSSLDRVRRDLGEIADRYATAAGQIHKVRAGISVILGKYENDMSRQDVKLFEKLIQELGEAADTIQD